MWDNVNMCQNECWVKKLQKDTYNAVSYSLKTVLCIAMGMFVNTVVSIKMYVGIMNAKFKMIVTPRKGREGFGVGAHTQNHWFVSVSIY